MNQFNKEMLISHLTKELKPYDWCFLSGDLGAGKTTFVSEYINSLTKTTEIYSPTFSIINSTKLKNIEPFNGLIHMDLYRIKNEQELNYLGLENEYTGNELVFIEWPEMVSEDGWQNFFSLTKCILPKRILLISIIVEEHTSNRIYTLNQIF